MLSEGNLLVVYGFGLKIKKLLNGQFNPLLFSFVPQSL